MKNPSDWDFIMGVFLTSSSPSFFNILTEAEGFRDDDVDEGALLVVVAVVVASTGVVVVSGTSFCSILHWKFENL